jgi:hypothetical protein
MSEEPCGKTENSWTVARILEKYDRGEFGIPHFQRGFVWDEAMRGALLESLYFDTPCGSLVVWDQGPVDCGVSLAPGTAAPTCFLVDGQQRVRSLVSVARMLKALGGTTPSDDISNCDEEEGGLAWFFNLARIQEMRVPELMELLQQKRELPLFVLRRKATQHNDSEHRRLERCLVPVSELLTFARTADWNAVTTWMDVSTDKKTAFNQAWAPVSERLAAIPRREFFVRKLSGDFAEVVRVYNRINSAGKRVDAAERALATLSALNKDTSSRLKNMFDLVHRTTQEEPARLERDMVLRRQRERSLGLQFFMRVFIQTCCHHMRLPVESSSTAFEAIDREQLKDSLRTASDKKWDTLWERATCTAECIARVLRDELFCDDFRFVPDAASLMPITQLLLRFPELAGKPSQDGRVEAERSATGDRRPHDARLAALLLRSFLCEKREVLELAEHVRVTTEKPGKIFQYLERHLEVKTLTGPDSLEARLVQSNSERDRYVLLLYWLERERKVRDFSYLNLETSGDEKTPARGSECEGITAGNERIVSRDCHPEKQHIVPMARIGDAVDQSRKRSRKNRATNIGNLTYISRALNTFTGLGDKPVALDLELNPKGHPDGENVLFAHFLCASEEPLTPEILESDDVAAEYAATVSASNTETMASAFERFCAARRKLIATAFHDWLSELQQLDSPVDDIEEDAPLFLEPHQRLLTDEIRKRTDDSEPLLELVEHALATRALLRVGKGGGQASDSSIRLALSTRARLDPDQKATMPRRLLTLNVDNRGLTLWLVRKPSTSTSEAFDNLLALLGQKKPVKGPLVASITAADARANRTGIEEAFEQLLDTLLEPVAAASVTAAP